MKFAKSLLPAAILSLRLASFASALDKKDGALLAAIEHKDKAAVEEAVRSGANVNAKNDYGDSAVMLAAEKGDQAIVDLLIAKGADTRYATRYNKTLLMFAARSGNLALVKDLY